MNVIFAGTPEFAAAALSAIVEAGFSVPLVLTQPDRPKGRGLNLQESPVKQTARQLGLPVAQPEKLRGNAEALAVLKETAADVMVVAAYGLILPQDVLDAPKHGCLNIHASLLPRWRGAAPIQRAIAAGDAETGVCIMQMDAGLDTGAVVSEHRYAIQPEDTAADVHDALAQIGAAAIVADLRRLQTEGSLNARPQAGEGVTYAAKLSKEEAQINWREHAQTLARQIRAFNPVPGAWCPFQGQNLKIWRARTEVESGPPATVLRADKNGILVACGEGSLLIEELQPQGGKRMTAAAFLAGRTLEAGKPIG